MTWLVTIVIALPAALIASLPRRWRGRVVLACCALPAALSQTVLAAGTTARPEANDALRAAADGPSSAGLTTLLPWLAIGLIGLIGVALSQYAFRWNHLNASLALNSMTSRARAAFKRTQHALGLVLRLIRGRAAARAVPGPMPSPAMEWHPLPIGLEGDDLEVQGLRLWRQNWRSVPSPVLRLPHPAYPAQRHDFRVYEVGPPEAPLRFAAANVSNLVWAFYRPGPAPAGEAAAAAPRLGAWRVGRGWLLGLLLAIFGGLLAMIGLASLLRG